MFCLAWSGFERSPCSSSFTSIRWLPLDSHNIDPEAGVIRLVSRVAIDLLLDPVDGILVVYAAVLVSAFSSIYSEEGAITVDILGVRIVESAFTVSVASEPLLLAIVFLAIPAGGDIGIHVRTRHRHLG
jgi:hypothetical protein